jgi:hypothetical protein
VSSKAYIINLVHDLFALDHTDAPPSASLSLKEHNVRVPSVVKRRCLLEGADGRIGGEFGNVPAKVTGGGEVCPTTTKGEQQEEASDMEVGVATTRNN